jgi:hypothetical protein
MLITFGEEPPSLPPPPTPPFPHRSIPPRTILPLLPSSHLRLQRHSATPPILLGNGLSVAGDHAPRGGTRRQTVQVLALLLHAGGRLRRTERISPVQWPAERIDWWLAPSSDVIPVACPRGQQDVQSRQSRVGIQRRGTVSLHVHQPRPETRSIGLLLPNNNSEKGERWSEIKMELKVIEYQKKTTHQIGATPPVDAAVILSSAHHTAVVLVVV